MSIAVFDLAGRAAVDPRCLYGKEEVQTAEAHFPSSSAFLIVLHVRIMLLIRILPGLMPEPNQLPLSNNAEGAAGFLREGDRVEASGGCWTDQCTRRPPARLVLTG